MSVVTWDISVTKRQINHTHDNRSSTVDVNLYDYLEIARRCIGAFASGSLASSMLRNEDAISFVAEHLMYAAFRWKEYEGGRTLHSYLNMCAIRSIQRWILLNKRAKKKKHMSINTSMDDGENDWYENLADTSASNPLDELCSKEDSEHVCHLIETLLSTKQRECMELVYIQGLSGSEAARQLGVSRQAVHQHLNEGIEQIKVYIDNEQTKT